MTRGADRHRLSAVLLADIVIDVRVGIHGWPDRMALVKRVSQRPSYGYANNKQLREVTRSQLPVHGVVRPHRSPSRNTDRQQRERNEHPVHLLRRHELKHRRSDACSHTEAQDWR